MNEGSLFKRLFFFLIFAGLAAILQTVSQMAALRNDALQAVAVADSVQAVVAERDNQVRNLEQALASLHQQAKPAQERYVRLRTRVDSVYVTVPDTTLQQHPMIELQQAVIEEQGSVLQLQEGIILFQGNLLVLKDSTIADLAFAVDTLKAALPMNLPRLPQEKLFGIFPKPSKTTVVLGTVTVGALIYAASR
jgi:hypothetical protein